MATHSSILAWKIPWTEEPGGLPSMGVTRVREDLVTKPPPPHFGLGVSGMVHLSRWSLKQLLQGMEELSLRKYQGGVQSPRWARVWSVCEHGVRAGNWSMTVGQMFHQRGLERRAGSRPHGLVGLGEVLGFYHVSQLCLVGLSVPVALFCICVDW